MSEGQKASNCYPIRPGEVFGLLVMLVYLIAGVEMILMRDTVRTWAVSMFKFVLATLYVMTRR